MKKLLLAVVIGLVLILAIATTALADNGPHGNFGANDDACASCHSIHRAQNAAGSGTGGYLLISGGTIYQMCTNCHGGSGAYTDVRDGTYAAGGTEGDAGGCLFGGGFENTACQHTYTGKAYFNENLPIPSDPVQSKHNVDGATNTGTIWGAGNYNATATNTSTTNMQCTSCHDPHGNAGKAVGGAAMPSYRLLRYNVGNGYEASTTTYFSSASAGIVNAVAGAGTTTGVTVVDTAAKWYTVNSADKDSGLAALGSSLRVITYGRNDPFGRTRGTTYRRPALSASDLAGTSYSCDWTPVTVGATTYNFVPTTATPSFTAGNCTSKVSVTGTAFNNYEQRVGITMFCSQCHDRYLAMGNPDRTTASGDAIYTYRHSSGASAANGGAWSCVDCHFAHGTSATATTTGGPNLPNGAAGASLANDSALLKIDNRGLCIRCHGSNVGFNYSLAVP